MDRMQFLELTLDAPAENLALDEALLDRAETAGRPTETLRIWEPTGPFVVAGRSSRIDDEVDRAACRRRGAPILRRSSGGAAVVAGHGCLMYAVVLSYELRPHLRMIDQAHRFVLDTLLDGIRPLVAGASHCGTSDLAFVGPDGTAWKFSGNSLRCKRTHLLYHGTLLYDFPLELVSACLRHPPRRPDYREDRSHDRFVANLPVDPIDLADALVKSFGADDRLPASDWPLAETQRLAAEKYSQSDWTFAR